MMFRPKQQRKPLSGLEHQVMEVLWKRSPRTSEQVREALATRHPMKESTARTIIKRLEEKGYVERTIEGRANLYHVSVPKPSLAAAAVQQIIDRFCGGSVDQLILGMVDREILTGEELRRIAKKVEQGRKREKE